MPPEKHHRPDDPTAGDRWKRIESLFHQALDLPPDGRRDFLAAQCGDDEAMRAEVEKLLAADDGTDRYLDAPERVSDSARAAARKFIGRPDTLEPGARIDAYRLVELIGEGGMAGVWKAERADGQFEQTVAIKFIKRGMDTKDILLRFQQERQLLAGLQHPNIARLLGGGSTDDERPYLVMEHVEGKPLDEYADERHLTIRERLDLFRTVCDVVQSAHRNLVVHRDLKPSNILVTAEGRVKLLDFGIAKVLDPGGALDVTATESRLMTPRYASPEQVRGEAISTASDVYSLGVLLYELLTGHRPYELTSQSKYEIDQVICERVPARPSTSLFDPTTTKATDATPESPGDTAATIAARRRTDPRKLKKALAGDLDMIVMMALRKEPERRYASVQQLGEDIENYLKGRPVMARPDSWRYRTSKFVRRNPALVASLAVLLLVSVAAAIISSWFAVEAIDARDAAVDAQTIADREAEEAKRQTAIAEAVNEYLHRVLAAADPQTNPEGRDVTLRDAVSEAASDIDTVFAGQPEIGAAVHYTVGVILKNLGDMEEAHAQIERAVALRTEALGPGAPDTLDARGELGQVLIEWGRFDDAKEVLGGALEHARRTGDEHPNPASKILNNLGLVHLYTREGEKAEPYLREALPYQKAAHGESHADVATTMHNIGGALWLQGEIEQAEPFLLDALEMRRAELGELHPQVAQSLNTIGYLMQQSGRLDEAEPYLRESLEMRRRMFDPPHPQIGIAINNLANLQRDRGNLAEASDLVEEALAQWLPTLGEQHRNVVNAYESLGSLLGRQERYAEAERAYTRRLEILRRAEAPDPEQISRTLFALGKCLLDSDQPEDAESRFIEAREVLDSTEGAEEQVAQLVEQVHDLYAEAGLDDYAQRWTSDAAG